MEEELFKILDQAISINHKIVSYLIECAKSEAGGKDIDIKLILENPILKNLFEKEQECYRQIQDIMSKYGIIVTQMLEHVKSSYDALRYIPRNKINYNISGRVIKQEIEPSIYVNDEYRKMRTMEYQTAIKNIDIINRRLMNIQYLDNLDNLSFALKEEIIKDISEKRFHKDYSINQINKYLEDLKNKIDEIPKKEYDNEKQQLIQRKYMCYYQYLNSIYNGFLQENDIRYFRTIKKFVDDGLTEVILDMSTKEIEENILMNFSKPKDELKHEMKIIFGPSHRKSLEQKEKNTKKQSKIKDEEFNDRTEK